MFEGKRLDDILREAFNAGAMFGSRYPEYDAIPGEEIDLQFRAFRDALAGRPWGVRDWHDARKTQLAKETLRRAETEAGLW